MRRIALLLCLLVLLPSLGQYLHAPLEQQRLQSPDGRYTAIVTSPRLWQLLAPLAGPRPTARGHVHIVDADERSLGRIPLPRLAMAQDLEWIAHGARIRGVGAWNFRDGFYAYWNDERTFIHTQALN